jgi:uncharacterized alpha-E superfamily protein
MLSRTAADLYWAGRYIERADFLARLLKATLRLAALPSADGDPNAAWASAVASAGAAYAFAEQGRPADLKSVSAFLAFDPVNPSSIRCCLERARNNARAGRTAVSVEAWEAINGAWLDVGKTDGRAISRDRLAAFLDGVTSAVLAFDGAAHRSMLRSESYWFILLGGALERADNTARLLDVKYHLLLPKGEEVGGTLDYVQWTTILRTVSAATAYRWVYRDSLKPWLVADLLILNRDMPRSLAACYDDVLRQLDSLAARSGRRGPAHRLAARTASRLGAMRIEDVFAQGLHEFVQDFIVENGNLGAAIAEQYLF